MSTQTSAARPTSAQSPDAPAGHTGSTGRIDYSALALPKPVTLGACPWSYAETPEAQGIGAALALARRARQPVALYFHVDGTAGAAVGPDAAAHAPAERHADAAEALLTALVAAIPECMRGSFDEALAHEAGFRAGRMNLPLDTNPHDRADRLFSAWEEGWCDARRDAEGRP